MAKNRNKKKRNGVASMGVNDGTVPDLPQTKKGRPMKRLKNVQKMKTVEKAIAKNEKYAEKSSKIKSVADKGLKHLLHVTVKANTCLKQEEESVSLKKLRYHP
ncbi:hypothetical protein Gogos_017695, partial [Gossypium gossypioides]|nr:hypothetical protein [Gossypium gossypioides]